MLADYPAISHPTRIASSNIVLLMMTARPFWLGAGRTILLIGIFISVARASTLAQAGNTSSATPADKNTEVRADLAFDVVSIRPSNAGPNQFHMLVGDDQYSVVEMPLGAIILMAYFPYRMGSKARIVGAPGWLWDDKYDFVGKVGEADLPA